MSITMANRDRRRKPSTTHQPHRLASPRSRVALATSAISVAAIIVTAIIVAGIGGAHAEISLTDRALSLTPGTQYIAQHGLSQTRNIVHSACGFTMTLNRVYADINRVVVGYTITGPTNRNFIRQGFTTAPRLTDTHNAATTTFPALAGATTDLEEHTSGSYFAFDAGGITDKAHTRRLRLTVPSIRGMERVGAHPVAARRET